MKINKEKVAASSSTFGNSSIASKASKRYGNWNYGTTKNGVSYAGDAMAIGNWHSGSTTTWFCIGQYSSQNGCLIRAWGGSIFSYNGYSEYDTNIETTAHWRAHTASRAAVVVASGI